MNISRGNLWNKILFPEMVTHIPETANKIFLTFDDGPTPGITNQVLAFLSEYNAKATFFCTGKNAAANPNLIKEIEKSGHLTGNHGFNHLNGWLTKKTVYIDDCYQASKIVPNRIFRPPFGKITPGQYNHLKKDYTIYLWTALTWDFHPWISPEFCFKIATKHLNSGSILVFHDTEKASAKLMYALPRLLEYGLNQGYQFDILPLK
jgi:peptidoglycan/xylan/chitin deacetylase (PgdA/CDA1 family)